MWSDDRFGTTASYYGVLIPVVGIFSGIILFLKKELLKATAATLFSIITFFYSYQSLFSGFINSDDKNGALINQPLPQASAIMAVSFGSLLIFMVYKKIIRRRLFTLIGGVMGVAMLIFGGLGLFDIARGSAIAVSEINDKFVRHSGRSFWPYYHLEIPINSESVDFSVSQSIYEQLVQGDRVEVKYYLRSKQLQSIRKVKPVPASYIYKDPLNIFTVEYPTNWFDEVVPEAPHILTGQEQPMRASCDKKDIKLCLDEIISEKIIPNPNKLSLRDVVISANQQDTQDYGAIDDPDLQIHGVILGISTKGLILDNITMVNLIRKIYFENNGQVVEVTLSNIGDDDIGQFQYTFKLINSQ